MDELCCTRLRRRSEANDLCPSWVYGAYYDEYW